MNDSKGISPNEDNGTQEPKSKKVVTKQEDEKAYIECCCSDLEHVTRLWYFADNSTFHLEYILNKLPGKYESTSWKKDQSLGWFQFRIKAKRVKRYFVNIKNALIGRSQHFSGQAEWDPEDAWEIVKFINKKLNSTDDQK